MTRCVAAALLVVILAGCSSTYSNGLDSVRLALRRPPPLVPTAESVAAKPYFQMLATSPDGKAVMVLGGVEGDAVETVRRDCGLVALARHDEARGLQLQRRELGVDRLLQRLRRARTALG